ncbi:LLM class F420-dependent oxidoreductase [Streptomyces sp. SID3343]|uniref:LLM class F420-dependent oxidoreductase n=1 Tax=Streptomyces sp. SID3343 TaxID=2690260 RepID=UPI001367B33E|nr:LLM class F420-dependent oxidoreductase [Streptomyces sp. SID3343]MYW06024.1 LLM class F420-dependent oxidoreductase [Streptomyces sp. SID3343]
MSLAPYGITVPLNAPLADHPRLIRELRAAGYTDMWSAEVDGLDGFTPLTVAALADPDVRLGTAIVSPYTRGPATLAMTAAALADVAPGRFTLGVGAGSAPIVEAWNGATFERPYQRVRDTVRFLRAAFTGDKVTEEYETFAVRGFRLSRPPATPPRILVAALRPGMLRLAGREADGAILNWLSAEDVKRVVPFVHEGGPDRAIVARIFVLPVEDRDTVRAIGRRMITSYLTVPVYAEFHRWLGRTEELTPMWRAWAEGDRKRALDLVPDSVLDDLIVHGGPAECRAKIARYTDAGVTVPVLAVIDPRPDADPIEAALALAPTAPPR